MYSFYLFLILQWVKAKQSWVCSITALQEPAVWFRTEFVSVKDAKRVDVSVTYRVQPCDNATAGQYCKENIDLYVYHTNVSEAKLDPVKTNFDLGKVLPVTGVKEVKTLVTTVRPKAKGLYLAFLDRGACAAIFRVKVTYSFCSDVILDTLTQFPRTVAPFDNSEISIKEGKCSSKDSVNTTQLIGYCTSSGSWNMSSNVKCLCVPGFGYKGKSCDGNLSLNCWTLWCKFLILCRFKNFEGTDKKYIIMFLNYLFPTLHLDLWWYW